MFVLFRLTYFTQHNTLQVHPHRSVIFFLRFYLFIYFLFIQNEREREREAETQAEGEVGSMHWEPDVGFDPGSPGPRPGPKAGAKPLRHPGIPLLRFYFFFF